jgi:hypothetical protein
MSNSKLIATKLCFIHSVNYYGANKNYTRANLYIVLTMWRHRTLHGIDCSKQLTGVNSFTPHSNRTWNLWGRQVLVPCLSLNEKTRQREGKWLAQGYTETDTDVFRQNFEFQKLWKQNVYINLWQNHVSELWPELTLIYISSLSYLSGLILIKKKLMCLMIYGLLSQTPGRWHSISTILSF